MQIVGDKKKPLWMDPKSDPDGNELNGIWT